MIKNSSRLLSAGEDCQIVVHSIQTDNSIVIVDHLKDYYPVKIVKSFLNNANFAVTASEDGMIKVWNISKKE